MSATKSRGRGRPTKLDGTLASEIAALVVVGHSIDDVAQMVGVSRRSIERWRRRAWSTREADRACVELEQTIQRGRLAAAQFGQRPLVDGPKTLQPLDDLYAELDRAFG